MKAYPTPHIDATPTDFAKTVLMPGDPLRAKFIAENFLSDARLVNNVRGIQGYTGIWQGTRVSVMASGMGIPSIGIYSYELYHFFDVDNIIRVGSAGGLSHGVAVRDMILGESAVTNSNFGDQFGLPNDFCHFCDKELLSIAQKEAEKKGASHHVGMLFSSDTFYSADKEESARFAARGALGVEMEAAGLYMTATYAKKRALAICTVSDHLLTGEALPAVARQTSFTDMIEVALNTAVAVEGAGNR